MNIAVKWKLRKPNYKFSENIERYWFNHSIFKTHLANALTLLFPDVEKFFVRTVKNFLPDVKNEQLRKAILAFIGQETQHSIQHEKFWKNLQAQGYNLNEFLIPFRKFAFEFIEPVHSPEARLALTAGLEHYTTMLAEIGLENNLFQNAEPELKKLFEWHCVEELEHKAVAFDLLQEVNPSYLLRIYGVILASLVMLSIIPLATFYFVNSDKKLFSREFWDEGMDFLFFKQKVLPKGIEIFLEYFNPNFHPNQRDHLALIKNVELNSK